MTVACKLCGELITARAEGGLPGPPPEVLFEVLAVGLASHLALAHTEEFKRQVVPLMQGAANYVGSLFFEGATLEIAEQRAKALASLQVLLAELQYSDLLRRLVRPGKMAALVA